MKSKYALLSVTAIGIVVAQPAMAANLSSSQIDQMLQNIAIPIAMIASSILAIHIFSSGQLSYVQMRKQPGKIREVNWDYLYVISALLTPFSSRWGVWERECNAAFDQWCVDCFWFDDSFSVKVENA